MLVIVRVMGFGGLFGRINGFVDGRKIAPLKSEGLNIIPYPSVIIDVIGHVFHK